MPEIKITLTTDTDQSWLCNSCIFSQEILMFKRSLYPINVNITRSTRNIFNQEQTVKKHLFFFIGQIVHLFCYVYQIFPGKIKTCLKNNNKFYVDVLCINYINSYIPD